MYPVNRRETTSGPCKMATLTINPVWIRTTACRMLGLWGGVVFVMPCENAPTDANRAVIDVSVVTYIVYVPTRTLLATDSCGVTHRYSNHRKPKGHKTRPSANFEVQASVAGRKMAQ